MAKVKQSPKKKVSPKIGSTRTSGRQTRQSKEPAKSKRTKSPAKSAFTSRATRNSRINESGYSTRNNNTSISTESSSEASPRKQPKLSKQTLKTSSVTKKQPAKSKAKKTPEPSDWIEAYQLHQANSTIPKVKSFDPKREPQLQKLNFQTKDNIQYVFYPRPLEDNRHSGIVQIKPGCEKPVKRVQYSIKFFVLSGESKLKVREDEFRLVSGSLVTIPAGARYGLKNDSTAKCFLQFDTNV